MEKQRKPKITTPELSPDGEQQRAIWWRQRVMNMTREALSEVVSYSPDTIWSLETGLKHRAATWRRYKNACELVHRMRFPRDRDVFNWGV